MKKNAMHYVKNLISIVMLIAIALSFNLKADQTSPKITPIGNPYARMRLGLATQNKKRFMYSKPTQPAKKAKAAPAARALRSRSAKPVHKAHGATLSQQAAAFIHTFRELPKPVQQEVRASLASQPK